MAPRRPPEHATMARPSATALLLLLSLLAVAHCRTLESEPATDASTAESTSVVAVSDETGPPNPTVVQTEEGATEVVPTEQEGFLRLPSHRRHHRPLRHGLFHHHLWWASQHGLFGEGHRLSDGEPRVAEAEEVKPVAEPDPDRSLRDSDDSEGELVRKPFRDGEKDGDEEEAVKRWRKEMLWRMLRHGLRHHQHHHHKDEEEDHHDKEEEGTTGVKRFRHHDHDDDEEEDEEKEKKMRKLIHFHHHHHEEDEEKMRKPFHFHHAEDGEDEDEELEEMVRRFRKAILRRRFHHGRFFHHHHGHGHHAGEVKEQSDGEQKPREDGGVVTWIKGLMNRF